MQEQIRPFSHQIDRNYPWRLLQSVCHVDFCIWPICRGFIWCATVVCDTCIWYSHFSNYETL